MYLSLFKKGKRVTSLAIGIHGTNFEELKQYATNSALDYDEVKKQTTEAYHLMLEEESKLEESEAEVELRRIETEAKALQEAIKELKEEYLLADMQGDEETKQALREEYLALVHEELNNEED